MKGIPYHQTLLILDYRPSHESQVPQFTSKNQPPPGGSVLLLQILHHLKSFHLE